LIFLSKILWYGVPFWTGGLSINSMWQLSTISKIFLSELEKEINNLLGIGVIKQVAFDEHQYISPIFTVPKKDKNEYRMILNLKELNEYIDMAYHFELVNCQ
jgi:hypothetical protein